MDAELIVVSGPSLGERYPLAAGPVEIGRAPSARVRLDIPEAARQHCVIKPGGGSYVLTDLRSGYGTYVNGMRVAQHTLEDGDQIGIGEAVLLFRIGATPDPGHTPQTVLLRACSFLFLTRALASAGNEAPRDMLETQFLRLVSDLMPSRGGFFLLGRGEAELQAAVAERGGGASLVARGYAEGPVIDTGPHTISVPLYVRGKLRGLLSVEFPPSEAIHFADHRDTLSAIATLATAALESAQEVERLRTENAILHEMVPDTGRVVGDSAPVRKLMDMVARVAPLDTSVLLLGESGTGKEVIARALHQQSQRHANPFVAINCAAITDTLLESELFGHEKGAFTGAVVLKKGKLEVAEGGTVFLDEIGELAMPLQAKLLRVLQQREFERVGGTKTIRLDVRLIAATNRDLAAEARRGAFREDLYHRLNVVALRTPPLRDRRDDIPALAQHFLERAAARCRRRVTSISPDALRVMLRYGWPGNVRELENAIERAVVLGMEESIQTEDLPETLLEAPVSPAGPGGESQDILGDAKRDAIMRAWGEANGDYKGAAKLLGVHPNSLLRMIRNLGIRDQLRP
jgi:transcriptional regulator with GAF, ATPase, and Fis domain